MRVCAVSLPELRVEIAAGDPSLAPKTGVAPPLAVVVAPPPMTERALLGNTRLSVVSREARALGVLAGQTIAQARARAGSLAVRVVRPDAVRDVLSRLAEVGLAFGATVAFDVDTDMVWVDVTGCAHLHTPPAGSIFDGETLLATRLAGVINALGHTCSIAVADGPRVAAMLAQALGQKELARRRGGARSKNAVPEIEPIVVRPGENAQAIAPLPIAALPVDADDVRWLTKLGVRTIGEMRTLPRPGLASRLGARARDVLGLSEGEDRAPLTSYVPPEIPEESTELEYGIEGTQALTFVAKTLTDRLAARIQGRAVAAARVELELHLDDALEGVTEPVVITKVDLPAPLSAASDLLAALRPKIERLVLTGPVLAAKLRAPVLVPKRTAALSLFEPQPKAERALPRLIGELVADLGAESVAMFELGDSWLPEERSRLVPFDPDRVRARHRRSILSSVPEPTRLLAAPSPIARDGVRITRHLTRLESVAWWRAAPTAPPARRDYVQAWTEAGAAWVEIDRGSGSMRVRGWFD